MRKPLLLLLLTTLLGNAACAQFWKKAAPVKNPVYIQQGQLPQIKFDLTLQTTKLPPLANLGRSRYSYDLEEAAIMKELYHTLRFRMYPEAIDGMNRLVAIYIEESRYSEAKWYLLQCNYFGHKSNNTKAVVASLIGLGMLKADIGEYDQARQDLLDAQDICLDQNMTAEASDIDKKLTTVEAKRIANVKNDVQYAEISEATKG
jgi:hypothetical protein